MTTNWPYHFTDRDKLKLWDDIADLLEYAAECEERPPWFDDLAEEQHALIAELSRRPLPIDADWPY